jgi:hypothetical protein
LNPSESILKRNLHAGMVVMLIALIGIMLPFLYQAFVEVIGIGTSKEDIAFLLEIYYILCLIIKLANTLYLPDEKLEIFYKI